MPGQDAVEATVIATPACHASRRVCAVGHGLELAPNEGGHGASLLLGVGDEAGELAPEHLLQDRRLLPPGLVGRRCGCGHASDPMQDTGRVPCAQNAFRGEDLLATGECPGGGVSQIGTAASHFATRAATGPQGLRRCDFDLASGPLGRSGTAGRMWSTSRAAPSTIVRPRQLGQMPRPPHGRPMR